MVRQFSKFPKRPADWLPPSAPLSMRKQVFLPDFTIALIRTPFLPPRYASFYVPLNFNKLDMRDYLKNLYGVDVLGVRSFVEQQKITRLRPMNKFGYGKWRRPISKKKMTVEMKQPFVWPEAPKDMAPWEHDQFHKAAKYQSDMQKTQRPDAAMQAPKEEREVFEEAAKEILSGSKPWRPTWQALGLSYDRPVVGGVKGAPSPRS
ncbi:hypothetical protein HFD88_007697 [Aspergillus terreus]|nr:hypothetical protein HFD88_007697 [Aspergillus terreus]